ncbi:hypothetical protein QQS21_007714 [Conoideocrella luteorostrata]|uniref:Mid2 domain-containing protein n=1 Tax=Conoideocrella luteorostrata TaxID=1105319 RepID=A0AAJ0FWQ8_9HYPO|nr:hypothetical protein QQS21_007714 [Conoideocrella luteorostrata]
MTFISGRQTTTTVTSWTGGALNAYSIQVRFQNTDFQNTTLSSPTTTLMVSTRSTATPTATDQNNASANGGLGKGAIAGIVVGGILGLGVIIGITYFLTRHFLLHKTAKDAEKPGKQANVATFENKMTHELPMNHTGHTVSELGADTVARQI